MIALKPSQTFAFSLDIDANEPERDRTRYLSRFLTAGQVMEIEELGHRADAPNLSIKEQIDLLLEAAAIALVEIRRLNSPPAGGEAIRAALLQLTPDELWEVCRKKIKQSRLLEDDRKKSALQSASAAVTTSAGAAAPPAGV